MRAETGQSARSSFVVVILLLTLFPVTSSPAHATPGEQYGRYRPRPVTVRRLPGGRVHAHHLGDARRLRRQRLQPEPGRTREVYAVNSVENDSLAAEAVLFLPGSGRPSSEIKAPLICAAGRRRAERTPSHPTEGGAGPDG